MAAALDGDNSGIGDIRLVGHGIECPEWSRHIASSPVSILGSKERGCPPDAREGFPSTKICTFEA